VGKTLVIVNLRRSEGYSVSEQSIEETMGDYEDRKRGGRKRMDRLEE
jgi:hypothetical protein